MTDNPISTDPVRPSCTCNPTATEEARLTFGVHHYPGCTMYRWAGPDGERRSKSHDTNPVSAESAFDEWYASVSERMPTNLVHLRPDLSPSELFVAIKTLARQAFEAGQRSMMSSIE